MAVLKLIGIEMVAFKTNKVMYDEDTDTYYIECPHCGGQIGVHDSDIRCTIFRHAVYKNSFDFVYPHGSREQCESWIKNDEIYGCGKPFIFDGIEVNKCGYI